LTASPPDAVPGPARGAYEHLAATTCLRFTTEILLAALPAERQRQQDTSHLFTQGYADLVTWLVTWLRISFGTSRLTVHRCRPWTGTDGAREGEQRLLVLRLFSRRAPECQLASMIAASQLFATGIPVTSAQRSGARQGTVHGSCRISRPVPSSVASPKVVSIHLGERAPWARDLLVGESSPVLTCTVPSQHCSVYAGPVVAVRPGWLGAWPVAGFSPMTCPRLDGRSEDPPRHVRDRTPGWPAKLCPRSADRRGRADALHVRGFGRRPESGGF
jgi:hypothetical protein